MNWQFISTLGELRNRHLKKVEKTFTIMNAVGSLFGFILMATGIKFALDSFVKSGEYGIEYLRSGIIAMVIILFILLQLLFCSGIYLSRNRGLSNWLVAGFGLTSFFFVAIPLMHEGRQLKLISDISTTDVEKYCSYFPQDLEREAPKWIREIFMLASRYDNVAE